MDEAGNYVIEELEVGRKLFFYCFTFVEHIRYIGRYLCRGMECRFPAMPPLRSSVATSVLTCTPYCTSRSEQGRFSALDAHVERERERKGVRAKIGGLIFREEVEASSRGRR